MVSKTPPFRPMGFSTISLVSRQLSMKITVLPLMVSADMLAVNKHGERIKHTLRLY